MTYTQTHNPQAQPTPSEPSSADAKNYAKSTSTYPPTQPTPQLKKGTDPESTVALPQDENRGVSATVRRSGPPCDQKRGQDSSGEGGGWLGLLRFELSGYAVRKIRKVGVLRGVGLCVRVMCVNV
eukprot:49494-Amorphochlora_amoeboformis.AAC.1